MNKVTIAGDVSSALTYFAALGAATIADLESDIAAEIHYTEDSRPKAIVSIKELEPIQLATIILDVAKLWSAEESWVHGLLEYKDGKSFVPRSPFSPRIKVIDDSETWRKHQEFRWRHIDELFQDRDFLALDFVGAIGESAYWRFESNGRRPDHGASRWEMKTRNKGQEFIKDRLALMVDELANWTPEQILSGLTGETLRDFGGKVMADSRTSTGFTTPGPTDVGLAFVALIGLTAFPLSHQTTRISATPGAYPDNVLHTRFAVFPIPTVPISLRRLESLILSKELKTVTENILGKDESGNVSEDLALSNPGAESWLRKRGVPAVAKYSVLKTGSSSAPERQILTGEVRVI